jgi:tRNA 2-thiocytidine biosynthesis protein TtcA
MRKRLHGELEKLHSRIMNRVGRACGDFDLLGDGDRILVCMSGGKDSYTLLSVLQDLVRKVPFEMSLVAFHLDQRQPGYPEGVMEDYLSTLDVEWVVAAEDTYSIVQEKLPEGATPCSLCSRLRRGIIYDHAEQYGCNKIALGHHRDDSVETLLLNLFHAGQLQAMPVRYTTDDERFEVIRPLLYVGEDTIARYAELMEYPIIPCNLCGSIAGQRQQMKALLDDLEETIPQVRNSMLAALGNVRVSHLLDRDLEELRDRSQEPAGRGCGDDVLF